MGDILCDNSLSSSAEVEAELSRISDEVYILNAAIHQDQLEINKLKHEAYQIGEHTDSVLSKIEKMLDSFENARVA